MDVCRRGWSWEEKGLGGRGCTSVHSTKLEQHSKHTVRHRIMDIHHERLTETTDLEEVNFSFGFVLKNLETGEVNYFYPSQSGLVFDDPVLVTNQEDLETLFKKVGDMDWMEWMRKEKRNSKIQNGAWP